MLTRAWPFWMACLLSLAPTWASSATPAAAAVAAGAAGQGVTFPLSPGDRVVFLGNTFAERMVRFGHFEAMLALRFPDHGLTFRNLGWSADTPALMPRPLNFGDVHAHLASQRPDVIFLCYGMAESFDGPEGVSKFERELTQLVKDLRSKSYNGKAPPRLVLVSPIPHEKLGGDLPDPSEHNRHLALYTDAVRNVAAANGVRFIDLYAGLRPLMDDPEGDKLTLNGIHLNDYGYWVAAQVMMEQLGLSEAKPAVIEIDANQGMGRHVTEPPRVPPPAPPGAEVHEAVLTRLPAVVVKNLKPGRYTLTIDGKPVATAGAAAWAGGVPLTAGPAFERSGHVRRAVDEKNRQFFRRYRAINGEYIYGRRKEPYGVLNFPGEMKQLDEIVAAGDRKVHELTKQPVASQQFEIRPEE